MNKSYFLGLTAALCAVTGVALAGDGQTTTIEISADKVAAQVSPMLYGLMTEEINYSYDGGLYAELIRNRTFRNNASNAIHWEFTGGEGAGSISIDDETPMNDVLKRSLKLEVTKASASEKVGVANEGFWGIPVKPNTKYRASFYAKGVPGFTGPLTVSIVNASNHTTVIATAQVAKISDRWQRYEATLTTGANAGPSKDNVFMISMANPGTMWLNLVSLFPPTWGDWPNGNRIDLMQLLSDMKPAFLRFPGGNYLEGNRIATRFNWKETIGDLSQRPGHLDDAWGYWSSDGVGLMEFLNWAEDLHMPPVLGVYGAYSMQQGADTNVDFHVQEALDEIEYVMGDVSTKWGAQRAKDGHPAPFKLEYVEVGNEDNLGTGGRTYDARFTKFYDAIKAKYPKMKVISTCPSDTRILTNRVPDIIDDHYYRPPQQMQQLATRYDGYSRSAPKIFVGEYASQSAGTNRQVTPCLDDALGDAAFLTGLERNADVVVMSAYAPLLVNVSNPVRGRNPMNSMQWQTDLIGYNALASYGSPAYYVQKMFSLNRGDTVLTGKAEGIPTREWTPQRRGGGAGASQQVPTIFYVATRDNSNGYIILKVVNSGDTAQAVHVTINGVQNVEATAQSVVLKGENRMDTNSLTDPMKIVPVTSQTDGFGKEFTRAFPALSVTILKLKAR